MKLRANPDSLLSTCVRSPERTLQRQRALVQEQLAWVDREIATLQGPVVSDKAPPVNVTPLPASAKSIPSSLGDAGAAELAAEEIMAQYKQEGQSLQSSVKRGCFLYFFAVSGPARDWAS